MVKWKEYLKTPQWAAKRLERLKIDGFTCVVCKETGAQYRLEVHHLHYHTLGNENPLLDLVTACSRCHPLLDNIWKEKRYAARSHKPTFEVNSTPIRRDIHDGMANTEISIDFIGPNANAQRPNSRPDEQMEKSTGEDYAKKGQNRR